MITNKAKDKFIKTREIKSRNVEKQKPLEDSKGLKSDLSKRLFKRFKSV